MRGKIYSKFEKRGRGQKHMGIPVGMLTQTTAYDQCLGGNETLD